MELDVVQLSNGSVHMCGEEPCEEIRAEIVADAQSATKPSTKDAETDMSLTPHWWGTTAKTERHSTRGQGVGEKALAPSMKISYVAATARNPGKLRGRATKAPTGSELTTVEPVPPKRPQPSKSPAVLIHVHEGRSITDTVGSIKTAADFPLLRVKSEKYGGRGTVMHL